MTRLNTCSPSTGFHLMICCLCLRYSQRSKRSKLVCAMWSFICMEFSKTLHRCCKFWLFMKKTEPFLQAFLLPEDVLGNLSSQGFAGSVAVSHPASSESMWEILGPSFFCNHLLTQTVLYVTCLERTVISNFRF